MSVSHPGRKTRLKRREQTLPLGWSFNPSAKAHRWRLIPFALPGFCIALYLTLCQVGLLGHAWDPFFGSGTDQVIHSSLSESFPIPDALLGALVYFMEIALLWVGPEERWLSQPWLALLSGLTVLGLGGGSLTLMFLQPVTVGHWCTLCLCAIGFMLILLQRSILELLATLQGLILALRSGSDLKLYLLRGAHREEWERLSHPSWFPSLHPWTEGTSWPWTLFLSAILGAGVLFVPELLHVRDFSAVMIYLAGTLTLGNSMLAMTEPLRPLRWLNALFGAILVFFWIGEPHGGYRWVSAAAGAAIILLCGHRGRVSASYGIFTRPAETQLALARKRSAFPGEHQSSRSSPESSNDSFRRRPDRNEDADWNRPPERS